MVRIPTAVMTRSGRRRLALALGAAAAVVGSSVALAGPASAACANFGCDGHNPNIQSWNGTATTLGENPISRCSNSEINLELRYGVTDGDPYSWARMNWQSGGLPGCEPAGGSVWVDRRSRGSGATETGLGRKTLLQSGWTTAGAFTGSTWSGMYFNSNAFEMRACVNLSGTTSCTGWF
jgi:hypothetical protein